MNNPNNIDDDLNKIVTTLDALIGNIEAASRMLADMCRRHDGFINLLYEKKGRSITKACLRRMEKCGNGTLIPELVFCDAMWSKYILDLTLDQQKAVLKGVRIPSIDGSHRIVDIADMSFLELGCMFRAGVWSDDQTFLRKMRHKTEMREYERTMWRSRNEQEKLNDDKLIQEIETSGMLIKGSKVTFPKGTTFSVDAAILYFGTMRN